MSVNGNNRNYTYQCLKETIFQLNFMVTPCINNIQHFNIQLMHTTLKSRVIKTF